MENFEKRNKGGRNETTSVRVYPDNLKIIVSYDDETNHEQVSILARDKDEYDFIYNELKTSLTESKDFDCFAWYKDEFTIRDIKFDHIQTKKDTLREMTKEALIEYIENGKIHLCLSNPSNHIHFDLIKDLNIIPVEFPSMIIKDVVKRCNTYLIDGLYTSLDEINDTTVSSLYKDNMEHILRTIKNFNLGYVCNLKIVVIFLTKNIRGIQINLNACK